MGSRDNMIHIFNSFEEAKELFGDKLALLKSSKMVLDAQIKYYMDYINSMDREDSRDFYTKVFKMSPLSRTWTELALDISKFERLLRTAQIHFKKVTPDKREEFGNLIEEARQVPITSLLEGESVRGVYCCPFHEETAPSLKIYPKTNSFYCFGCNTGGDVIKFVMLRENLDFKGAVKYLTGGSYD